MWLWCEDRMQGGLTVSPILIELICIDVHLLTKECMNQGAFIGRKSLIGHPAAEG